MAETIQRKLNDSPAARWTALLLIASTMFFGYMFVDLMSPLQSMIEAQRGWTPDVFGMYGSSEFIFNVFGFLILAGIILDKMGVRFTGMLSASLMFIGACIKYYGVSDAFIGTGAEAWLNSWWVSFPASAKLASLGFMIFGCGMEMAGITVSKAIAKWFEGKEMALAMGLEMAIARVGVFAIFSISPWLADMAPATVVRPVAFCTLLLLIGLLSYTVFTFMDRKLDKQLGLDSRGNNSSEEEFRISDLGKIFSSKVFWIVAILCVLYYSAIFPFQRFATNMLESNLGVTAQTAADIFRWFPMGAAAITPLLGSYLDHKGKAAREEGPQLILSDVVMPGMSGYELCHMIKDDLQTSHIPVILVTAKITDENKVEGLNSGADAYVTKPFAPKVLMAMIKSLLTNRERVRTILNSTTETDKDVEDVLSAQDKHFMDELYQVMEKEMANAELDVNKATEMMHVSRTKLYYKVKGLTGESPSTFFKTYSSTKLRN